MYEERKKKSSIPDEREQRLQKRERFKGVENKSNDLYRFNLFYL